MQFSLTDSQRTLRAETRRLADEHVRPTASALDEKGTYPADAIERLADEGYAGLTVPEAYGGRGAGMVELAVATEELAAASMSLTSAIALHLGVAEVVERFGTDAQRERWLPEMATFDTVAALGLSERGAGSDKSTLATTAERDGEEWVLAGHKRWVTNFAEADVVLTYARTSPEGASAFLVPAGAFEIEQEWETFGARSVSTVEVTLSDVRVPADRLVGAVGDGLTQRGRLTTGVNVPARAVGIARAALEDTVSYVTQREQYGRPLGDFQGLRWRVGEMATRVDTARLLTLRAAAVADAGAPSKRAFSMAKIAATEGAVANANEAMQLHGGVGYTTEHDVERYLRDARLLTLAGGPNEGHRDTLAAAAFANPGGTEGNGGH